MTTTTLEYIQSILHLYPISKEDRLWIKENVWPKQLQVLSSKPEDIVIPSHDERLKWFLSAAHYVVQNGKVIVKEDFDPERGGLFIIRPGSIHVYVVYNV